MLARQFARNGHDVVLVARNEVALNEVADSLMSEFAVRADVFVCDLAQPGAAEKVYSYCRSQGIDIGVLVNNAGRLQSGAIGATKGTAIREMISVNVLTLSELTGLFVPHLSRRARGDIINISSHAALQPVSNMAVYSATKAYVAALSDALRYELAGTSVKCFTVLVGPLNTEMLSAAGARSTPLALASRMSSNPDTIAEVIYDACLAGRMRYSPGLLGATLHFGLRTMPRSLAARIAKWLN